MGVYMQVSVLVCVCYSFSLPNSLSECIKLKYSVNLYSLLMVFLHMGNSHKEI